MNPPFSNIQKSKKQCKTKFYTIQLLFRCHYNYYIEISLQDVKLDGTLPLR